jgi:hypothetical protein
MSSLTDSLYWLKRGKFTSQTKLAVGLLVLLGAPVIVPLLLPKYSTAFAIAVIAVVLWYLFRSHYVVRMTCETLGNAKVCETMHVATPLTSMFAALRRQNVEIQDIGKLTIETGKFSDLVKYINGEGKILKRLIEQNPDAAIHIYGLNDLSANHTELKDQLAELGAPCIVFHNTRKISTTHRNVVRVKDGRIFIWFEEYHEIKDGHHYIPHGAMLLKMDSAANASKLEEHVARGIPFRRWTMQTT